MFDRALNALMYINCLFNSKKKKNILRLDKLIEEEDEYTRSAKNYHL